MRRLGTADATGTAQGTESLPDFSGIPVRFGAKSCSYWQKRMKVIERLYELQELELGGAKDSPEARQKIESIRKETPEPIMGHYDRLLARGKRAVAMVRHGVCTGCRIKLPSGSYAALLRDDDISMCENCGRYLMLSPEEQPEPVQLPAQQVPSPPPTVEPKPKPTRRTAKRKKQAAREVAPVKSGS